MRYITIPLHDTDCQRTARTHDTSDRFEASWAERYRTMAANDKQKMPAKGARRKRRPWGELEEAWRKWHGLAPDAHVDPADVTRQLRVLVFTSRNVLDCDGPPLEVLLKFVENAERPPTKEDRARGLEPADSSDHARLPSWGTEARTRAQAGDIGAHEDALRQSASVFPALPGPEPSPIAPTDTSSMPVPATPCVGTAPPSVDTLGIVAAVRAVVEESYATTFERRHSDARLDHAVSQIAVTLGEVRAAAREMAENTQTAILTVTAQRRDSTALGDRVGDALERMGHLAADVSSFASHAVAAAKASHSIQASLDEVSARVNQLLASLDGKVDLRDARDCLRIQQELQTQVEGYVRQQALRSVSEAVGPALDSMKNALAKGDLKAADEALKATLARYVRAGLTDINGR